MKRILVASLLVLMATPVFAGVITYDSTATATRSWINNSLSTVYNEFNGSIDTDNLQAGAVTSLDIATAANPLVRDAENIGEYVYTGLLPPTATGLTATTTAGTAYVLNDGDSTLHRVVKAATSKTYTASKDTWVYLGYDGSYTYEEVANDASQPTTPNNTILLAKVVTDGSDVTGVTDHRQTAPSNLRTYEDYRIGLTISRDTSDADVINIGRGEIEFGGSNGKVRRKTVSADVNFASSGRGGLDTGSQAASTIYYIFAVADDDNSTDWEGIASLSDTDASGVTGEKLIGWCYAQSTSVISPDSVGGYKGTGSSVPNVVQAIITGDTAVAAGAYAAISGIDAVKMVTSGRPVKLTATWFVTGSGSNTTCGVRFLADGDSILQSETRTETGIASHEFGASQSYIYKTCPGVHTFGLEISSISNINVNNVILIAEEL